MLALTLTCSLAPGTALAIDDVHPIVDDHARSLPDKAIDTTAQSAQQDFSKVIADIGSGGGPAPPNSPALITDPAYDWCRWWSFQDLANEVTNYPWLDINATLLSDLSRCLLERYPGDPLAWGAAVKAAQQNEQQLAQLVATVDPEADPTHIRLPIQTWSDWFTASADNVPPQS
ncbi:MAG: hypothetical protein ACTHMY_13610 [Solirubrobacteraceae bacterium]